MLEFVKQFRIPGDVIKCLGIHCFGLFVFFRIHCYVRNGQLKGWEIRWQDATRCDKLMICREELVPEGSYRLTTARKDPLVCGLEIQCNGFPFGHVTSKYFSVFLPGSFHLPTEKTLLDFQWKVRWITSKGVDRSRLWSKGKISKTQRRCSFMHKWLRFQGQFLKNWYHWNFCNLKFQESKTFQQQTAKSYW